MLVRLDSMVLTGAINTGQANLLKGLALKRDAQAADIFSSFRSKNDNELALELLPLLDPNRRFFILFCFLNCLFHWYLRLFYDICSFVSSVVSLRKGVLYAGNKAYLSVGIWNEGTL